MCALTFAHQHGATCLRCSTAPFLAFGKRQCWCWKSNPTIERRPGGIDGAFTHNRSAIDTLPAHDAGAAPRPARKTVAQKHDTRARTGAGGPATLLESCAPLTYYPPPHADPT